MVFRILMRYIANNEQLVQQLSESKPVRRTAQLLVAAWYRTKRITENSELTPERFRNIVNSFKQNLNKEIENAKEELKKKGR